MQFYRPQSIGQVNELWDRHQHRARLIAGGTDLLVEFRQKNSWPADGLIDLTQVQGIHGIEDQGDHLSIGAATTHDAIVKNDWIQRYAPILAGACRQIGSQQIRNRGTIGGNICNASPCADSIPALFVMNARLQVASMQGERIVSVQEFFSAPYRTVLAPGEWLKGILIPKADESAHWAFIKLGRRNAMAISRMSMAVMLWLNDKQEFSEVRVAPGSVFPVWRRVTEVEQFLAGKKTADEVFERAGRLLAEIMIQVSGRRWSTPYKEPVVAALLSRVLRMAVQTNSA